MVALEFVSSVVPLENACILKSSVRSKRSRLEVLSLVAYLIQFCPEVAVNK